MMRRHHFSLIYLALRREPPSDALEFAVYICLLRRVNSNTPPPCRRRAPPAIRHFFRDDAPMLS